MSFFIEYSFFADKEIMEIIMAELSIIEFNSFEETENELRAYILEKDDEPKYVEEISNRYNVKFEKKKIKKINWNREWEKNFSPIEIKNRCIIRAPFHTKSNIPIDLVIMPKMSFGTGHHSTTYMMIEFILEGDFHNKEVCDLGCGTGILGILADKKGTKKVDSIDIDEWCIINSKENIELNNSKNINVFKGEIEVILDKKYDVILANINKNVLLKDMEYYNRITKNKGILYLSGFYKDDKKDILDSAQKNNFIFLEEKENQSWMALKLEKVI